MSAFQQKRTSPPPAARRLAEANGGEYAPVMPETDPPSLPPGLSRRPDLLSLWVVLLVVWNAVILWLALTGQLQREVGNDAAGAGMARGFRELFATAGAFGIALMAVPALIVRAPVARAVLIGSLALASLVTPMLL